MAYTGEEDRLPRDPPTRTRALQSSPPCLKEEEASKPSQKTTSLIQGMQTGAPVASSPARIQRQKEEEKQQKLATQQLKTDAKI